MMVYIDLIAAWIVLIFIIYRVYFIPDKSIVNEEEIIDEIIVEEEKVEELIIEEKPEKEYELNVNFVKFDLFPRSTFHDYFIKRLYTKIIVNNYWIAEPFHSKFTQLLCFIDQNELWIKSQKSKEIVLNIRDKNNQIKKSISMKVVDLREVLFQVCSKIISITKPILKSSQIQHILLSAVIFILEKSGQIRFICQNQKIDYKSKDAIYDCLVNIFFTESSKDVIDSLSPINNSNYKLIKDTSEEIILNSEEYPNSIYDQNDEQKIEYKLSILPKKKLISIE